MKERVNGNLSIHVFYPKCCLRKRVAKKKMDDENGKMEKWLMRICSQITLSTCPKDLCLYIHI